MTNPFYTATGAPVQESRGTSPAVRNEFALLQTAFDEVFDAIDIGEASGTSTDSLTVGTGSKSFTIQAGRAFSPGQSVVLAYNVTPTTQMTGTITSYNRTTGAVVMNVTGTNGSGTYADWTLSLNPSGATLGANVFTGAQDWATGANIASASTVNLDTTTGNRVHITGTTTITAWTLTRGPRTVIFDGALQLTYHATNNRLNSNGANVTVEAGDMAYIESDGTTVFVNVIKKSGAAVAGSGSLVLLSTINASGASTVDIETTFDATYDVYVIEASNITVSAASADLFARMKIGGAYDTGSNYKYHRARPDSGATSYAGASSASDTAFALCVGVTNASSEATDIAFKICRPSSTTRQKSITWFGGSMNGALHYPIWAAGRNTGTGAMTGLRIYPSTGTLSGTFCLYGIKK